jgi:hypothetical protein
MTGLLALLDNAAGNATYEIYKGTRPASGAAPGGGDLLTTVPLGKPVGSVATTGVNAGLLVLAPSGDGQLLISGAPTWARLRAADGTFVRDLAVRLVGDADTGQELVIASAGLLAGAFVRISSGSLQGA